MSAMHALTLFCQHVATCLNRWITALFQIIIPCATPPFLPCIKSVSTIMLKWVSPAKKYEFANAILLPKQDRRKEKQRGIFFIFTIFDRGLTQSRVVLLGSTECVPFIIEVLLALVSGFSGFECRKTAQFGLFDFCQNAAPWHYATSSYLYSDVISLWDIYLDNVGIFCTFKWDWRGLCCALVILVLQFT